MRNIEIEDKFYQELLKNIQTSLIHTGVEILDYYKKGQSEYLKLLFPFTTTGNILTYQYEREIDKLSLIDASIYTMSTNKNEEFVDKNTIMKLYEYCRKQTRKYIDNQKIEQIYDMVINKLPITDESLINNGFNSNEIEELLEQDILQKSNANEYTLSSMDKFYRYGIKMLLLRNYKKATMCFKICYQKEPNNRKFCLQLLSSNINLGNYTHALQIFSHLEKISTEENLPDNNLYLYILSQLTDCKGEYQERIEHMKTEDVLVSYDDKNKQNQENDIRLAIMKGKYKYALNLLNDILPNEQTYDIKKMLLKELLCDLISMEDKFKLRLLSIAKTKQYGVIILFLRKKEEKRKLNITERCIYLIVEDILDITKTKIVPHHISTQTNRLYEAIANRNYKLAQKLNRRYLEFYNISPEEDILDVLLTDINKLILRIKLGQEDDILKQSLKDFANDFEKTKKYAQDLAHYINSQKLTIEDATEIYGLTQEQVLLSKLIYAKDYYVVGLYSKGDAFIQEVIDSKCQNENIVNLLNEIMTNRAEYINTIKPYVRKRTPRTTNKPPKY